MLKGFFVSLGCVLRYLFAVNIGCGYKGHILIVIFMIFQPSSVKAFSAIPRDEVSELCNGRLEIRENPFQYAFNSEGIFRPLGGDRIESLQFSQKNISKIGRGDSKPIQATVEVSKVKADSSHNNSATNAKKPEVTRTETDTEDYHILWSLLPMYIMTFYWIIIMFVNSCTQR